MKKKGLISNDSIAKKLSLKSNNKLQFSKTTLDSFMEYNTTYESLTKGLNKPVFINDQWLFINVIEKLPKDLNI